MPPIPFIGQSARPRSLAVGELRALNCYAEVTEHRQGKALAALYGRPGLTVWTTLTANGGVRGLHTTGGQRVFAVQGGGLFELLSNGTSHLRGSLHSTSGPVSLDDTPLHLFLADGVAAYALTLSTNVLTPLTEIGPSDRVTVIDNYGLFNRQGTGEFLAVGPLAATVDLTEVATAEGAADPIVSLISHQSELRLLGSQTLEGWFNVGTVDQAFQRIPSAFIETGCAAAHSVAKMGGAIYWLGADAQGHGIVWQAEGYQPRRVSTHPLELALQGYSTISDAVGWTEQIEGHYWYTLTFPTADTTWRFDATTSLWHELAWLDRTTGRLHRHRGTCHTFAFGKHLYGDWGTGSIYESSLALASDSGDAIRREVQLPPVYDAQGLHTVQHRHLTLDMEVGVGLDGGVVPGTDPQIMMQMSNDGGKTWGAERWRSLGPLGNYTRTVEWWQLGQAADRRYRFVCTEPCTFALVGAYLDTTVLAT